MALSQEDIQLIAEFVRTATKAVDEETVISVTFQTLKQLARVDRLRIVYPPGSGRWIEWKAAKNTLGMQLHDEWPAPDKKAVTLFFEAENAHSGFISSESAKGKARDALEMLAPQVWSALLLQLTLSRVKKAAVSETELVRATLRARDEERRHIARELHDDLGQAMVSLRLKLKWAEDNVRRKTQPDAVVR